MLGLRLASHRIELGPADLAVWRRLEPRLCALRPPTVAELASATGIEAKKIEALLARASRQGLAVRVSKNRFFLPEYLKNLERIAQDVARSGAGITAAAFRDRSGIGRNVTIEVLEYFDRVKFTRRVGDAHVLR
jgi:selenocysteine-specific elongation factor